MAARKLGIGIIGCGKAGNYHAYWYSRNANCNLIGFYNRTKSKALDMAKKYNARVYDKWEELVNEDKIDIVSVCTPVSQHREQVCYALSRSKHVLCEKPMACTVEECNDIINMSEKSGNKLGVFFNMRFNPVVEAVDKNIKRIGELLNIDISFQFNREELGWRGKSESNTGVLMELGTHAVDLAIYWFNDIVEVKSEVNSFIKDNQCDDHVYAIFRFKNGSVGKLYTSYNDPSFYDQIFEGIAGQILGRDGKICFLLNSYVPEINRVFIIKEGIKEEIELRKPSRYDPVYPGHTDSFGKLIDNFIDSIIKEKEFVPSGMEGLKTIKFVEDAYRSSNWR